MSTAKTGAQRQAAYAAKGWAISVVITDPAAVEALAKLVKANGGIKSAIESALRGAVCAS